MKLKYWQHWPHPAAIFTVEPAADSLSSQLVVIVIYWHVTRDKPTIISSHPVKQRYDERDAASSALVNNNRLIWDEPGLLRIDHQGPPVRLVSELLWPHANVGNDNLARRPQFLEPGAAVPLHIMRDPGHDGKPISSWRLLPDQTAGLDVKSTIWRFIEMF